MNCSRNTQIVPSVYTFVWTTELLLNLLRLKYYFIIHSAVFKFSAITVQPSIISCPPKAGDSAFRSGFAIQKLTITEVFPNLIFFSHPHRFSKRICQISGKSEGGKSLCSDYRTYVPQLSETTWEESTLYRKSLKMTHTFSSVKMQKKVCRLRLRSVHRG